MNSLLDEQFASDARNPLGQRDPKHRFSLKKLRPHCADTKKVIPAGQPIPRNWVVAAKSFDQTLVTGAKAAHSTGCRALDLEVPTTSLRLGGRKRVHLESISEEEQHATNSQDAACC